MTERRGDWRVGEVEVIRCAGTVYVAVKQNLHEWGSDWPTYGLWDIYTLRPGHEACLENPNWLQTLSPEDWECSEGWESRSDVISHIQFEHPDPADPIELIDPADVPNLARRPKPPKRQWSFPTGTREEISRAIMRGEIDPRVLWLKWKQERRSRPTGPPPLAEEIHRILADEAARKKKSEGE